MKKLISAVLAFLMAFSMGISALAVELEALEEITPEENHEVHEEQEELPTEEEEIPEEEIIPKAQEETQEEILPEEGTVSGITFENKTFFGKAAEKSPDIMKNGAPRKSSGERIVEKLESVPNAAEIDKTGEGVRSVSENEEKNEASKQYGASFKPETNLADGSMYDEIIDLSGNGFGLVFYSEDFSYNYYLLGVKTDADISSLTINWNGDAITDVWFMDYDPEQHESMGETYRVVNVNTGSIAGSNLSYSAAVNLKNGLSSSYIIECEQYVTIVEIGIDINTSAEYQQSYYWFTDDFGNQISNDYYMVNDVGLINYSDVRDAARYGEILYAGRDVWGYSAYFGEGTSRYNAYAIDQDTIRSFAGYGIEMIFDGWQGAFALSINSISSSQEGFSVYNTAEIFWKDGSAGTIYSLLARFEDDTVIKGNYDLFWYTGITMGELRSIYGISSSQNIAKFYVNKGFGLNFTFDLDYRDVNYNDVLQISTGNGNEKLGTWILYNTPSTIAKGKCEDNTSISWNVDSSGELVFSGSGMIPNTYTELGGPLTWVTGCEWGGLYDILTKVTIKSGITGIGWGNFTGCTEISKVVIPSTVTTVAYDSFEDQYNIFSAGPTGGGYGLEFGWTKSIPDNAFSGMYNLNGVTLPSGITYIGESAFERCYNLKSISIPSNVNTIGPWAFVNCDSLKEVSVPKNVKVVDEYVFFDCDSLTKVVLPEGLTTIGAGAFEYCTNLATINIPSTVTAIGAWAFDTCYALKEITIPKNVKVIDEGVFFECQNLSKIVLPEGLTTIGAGAFEYCYSLATINLPSTLLEIGPWAFYDCGINKYYFEGNAPSVYSLSSVGASFDSDDTIYYLEDNSTWVISGGKWNGYTAKTWTLPNIASGKCGTNLSWVLSNDGTLTISGTGAMTNYSSVFDSSTGENGTNAPWQNYESKVKSLVIGEGATSIGEFAFYNFSGIKGSIVLPKSLKTIGNSAFADCSGFSGTLTIPDSVTTISSSAFRGCSGLTGLKLGSKVATIGNTAFRNCAGIKGSITIPASVTEIGNFTFRDTGITAVYFEGNAPKVSAGNETNSSFGSNVTVYYDNAFSGWNIDSAGKWCGYKTATWQNPTVTRYTVSYNANGGSGAPASQSKAKGVDLTLSTVQPTRSGYTFKGWATSSTGSVKYAPGAKYTTDANVTLYAVWEKVPVTPSESATITVSPASAGAGDTVEIPVKISGNPGFASVQMRVEYDKSVLTLVDIRLDLASNCLANAGTNSIAGASASDITGDGTLFTLVFYISEDAEPGSYEVDINVLEFYNASDKKIDVTVLSGTVEVADYIPGDANGDGVVSSRDATRILQYLVGSVGSNSIDLAAADYNGDGSVSSRDATAILKFLISG